MDDRQPTDRSENVQFEENESGTNNEQVDDDDTTQASEGTATQQPASAILPPAPPRDPFGLGAIIDSGAFNALLASQRAQALERSRATQSPSAATGRNGGSLPRTATNTTSTGSPVPALPLTVPAALMEEYRRTLSERERADLARRIEAVLAQMATFALNSDPAASGTRTTLADRRERLTQDCPISLLPITRPCETVCGHVFQAEVLAQAWLTFRRSCPMCRTPLLLWQIPLRYGEMHLLQGESLEEERMEVGESGEKPA